ncbi:uncharacterized protein LOC126845136 isoform X1 [Adelges cooleyi]|uniref:uncharacterized protein LOC126845136 isoform X1 n=1 Tax=Adelges cooleyi TaxID=133065 RepID=UPI00217F395F|nr:uncharacterized protein LOC126845136 isoform X1 [Adelges cooleyi]XP_050439654.1 uncharacterized protein LOC126845136 isoform X1 [Adelges cooleyi]XP_050439655.1 uncharacterized protein LOC126845136 isoform X1 [Adelges cooleyi]XP_050439656.1 uncharacterized protein LOC126845136 isoform X1 [Adelges cooleyi]
MKSNASVALVAVYLFGLIVSLNSSPMGTCGSKESETSDTLLIPLNSSPMVPGGGETSEASNTLPIPMNCSPMVPGGGETSGTSETSNILAILKHKSVNQLSKAELQIVTEHDFKKALAGVKNKSILSCFSKIQLDPEFVARLIDARNILLGCEKGNHEDQEKNIFFSIFFVIKSKLKETLGQEKLNTKEYENIDKEIEGFIFRFIGKVI